MRVVREMGPLAVVTVVALGVTTWLLGENPTVGRWALAVILFGHGWVHLMFVFPRPGSGRGSAEASALAWPFDLRASWLVRRVGFGAGTVMGVGRILVAATLVVSLLAALATAGLLVPAAWWTGLVIGSAAGSLALLAMSFAPTLVVGAGIDVWLVWIALAGPWSPVA